MLNITLATFLPKFVCLTETWIKQPQVKTINLDSYKLQTYFSRCHSNGGGTCIFVRDNLDVKTINMHSFAVENIIEMCAVQWTYFAKKCIILNIYRPPASSFQLFLNNLSDALNYMNTFRSLVFVCGDFNINFSRDTHESRQLNHLLLSYGLVSVVNSGGSWSIILGGQK